MCVVLVDGRADALDERVRLGQVFAGGAIAFDKVRNRVHAQRVHAHIEPEAHRLQHFFHDQGIVEVEVGLVREKTVPVVGLCRFVPRPVRFLRVREDDARVFVKPGRVCDQTYILRCGEPGGASRAALNQGC